MEGQGHGHKEGPFVLRYMGASMLDSRIVYTYTHEMVPWIISEILRFSQDEQVILQIRNSVLSVYSTKNYHNITLLDIPITDCVRHFQVGTIGPTSQPGPTSYFGVIVRSSTVYHHVRLFAGKAAQVAEIVHNFSEASRVAEPPATAVGMSPGTVDNSDAISFEVLYLGKLRMYCRRAPSDFVDEGLDRIRELTQHTSQESSSRGQSSSRESSDTGSVGRMLKKIDEPDSSDRKVQSHPTLVLPKENGRENLIIPKAGFPHPLDDVTYSTNAERTRTASGDSALVKSLSLPVEPPRNRALSTGNDPRDAKVPEGVRTATSGGNRTMILILCNREVRIISPDAKTTLLHKSGRTIVQLGRGHDNQDCFGFVCREASPAGPCCVGFIFRCESVKLCTDILQTMRKIVSPDKNELYCDHCPMLWFHQLCVDVEGLADERIKTAILKRIDELSNEERQSILTKFKGADTPNLEVQIELMMMLIRAHCETKQLNHVHDTPENRHEFLQSYLGSGAIFMKAKRSLTSSFDQFLKRKELKGTTAATTKFNPFLPHHVNRQGKEMSPDPDKSPPRQLDMTYSDSPLDSNFRKRSSTLGAVASEKIISQLKNTRRGSQVNPIPSGGDEGHAPKRLVTPPERNQNHSPMMNIFLKVGAQQSTMTPSGSTMPHRKGSWRQAIFKRVVSPSSGRATTVVSPQQPTAVSTPPLARKGGSFRPKKTKEQVQDLWRSAIKQQILLNRMDRQNNMLKTKQEEANLKRNKLAYNEMCSSGDCENRGIDVLTAAADKGQLCDNSVFRAICITGIPKHRRGQVWEVFLDQFLLRAKEEADATFAPNGINSIPSPNTSYDQLLRLLTSHQHAILIDLGRTFPNHPYFSRPLGSGQLALFNLLKAYSLLDPDVGYCQGLSFLAGLLLMHLEEEEAFGVLKHFMFEMGGREYYQPDMSGLQLKLYQLNRLIHDQDPDVHLLLYHNDVLPSLYAAPWFLTMFASQFPIGFAVRVLDLALIQGPDVMVKFALLLIQDHKKQLMECCGLEQIMECFKNVVTQITPAKVDEYVKKAFDMKIKRQMLVYGIEYSVMQDETFLAYLSDPRNQLSKKRSVKGNHVGAESPTPSGGSDEDTFDSTDVQSLASYVASLEDKLRSLGHAPVRPSSVVKVLERNVSGSLTLTQPVIFAEVGAEGSD